MELIREEVEDQPFIDLVYKVLKAGYVEGLGKLTKSEKGTPQGGTLSPLLANIYLDAFDK